ncbi:unnamed protein product [Acanthoscelides obtectus]|uniref:Uncharacterized protein n=1 Tax=Acanthoscelides obtectus TaxID=200917 RepID=A0A9P0MBG1_ACAOB|nr:unnamed protein product [Acanthoscelides obtectus]CAK1632001.1 hypothetical protein AOBTE_LOCUS7295 [Acanthoscelides obtectus]
MKHCKHKCSVTFRLCLWPVHEKKRILAALCQNDESNNVYFVEEIGSMPISIISSDNIFDLDNSENILKTTSIS